MNSLYDKLIIKLEQGKISLSTIKFILGHLYEEFEYYYNLHNVYKNLSDFINNNQETILNLTRNSKLYTGTPYDSLMFTTIHFGRYIPKIFENIQKFFDARNRRYGKGVIMTDDDIISDIGKYWFVSIFKNNPTKDTIKFLFKTMKSLILILDTAQQFSRTKDELLKHQDFYDPSYINAFNSRYEIFMWMYNRLYFNNKPMVYYLLCGGSYALIHSNEFRKAYNKYIYNTEEEIKEYE